MTHHSYSGPLHESECLAASVKSAPCRCKRRAWLEEMVPRGQARDELLAQLAGWAREQGIFARADVENVQGRTPGLSQFAAIGLRSTAHLVEEIYISVRIRALAMREECAGIERPGPAAVVTAQPAGDQL